LDYQPRFDGWSISPIPFELMAGPWAQAGKSLNPSIAL
jgi:hypothetical protein